MIKAHLLSRFGIAVSMLAFAGFMSPLAYAGPGNATDTRVVECHDDLGIHVDDSLCAGAGAKPATTQVGASCTSNVVVVSTTVAGGTTSPWDYYYPLDPSQHASRGGYWPSVNLGPASNGTGTQSGYSVGVYVAEMADWRPAVTETVAFTVNGQPESRSISCTPAAYRLGGVTVTGCETTQDMVVGGHNFRLNVYVQYQAGRAYNYGFREAKVTDLGAV